MLQPPRNPALHLRDITAHLEKHIGKVENVFHEFVSSHVHIDLLHVPATEERPYQILATSGMSDEAMAAPAGCYSRAELLIALPKDWPVTGPESHTESSLWPAQWLRSIARLPHEEQTWIGLGHTIPNGEPPEPIADTRFIGVLVAVPFWMPEEFLELTTESGETIAMMALIPLYPEEMELKLREGPAALVSGFDAIGLQPALDIRRRNAASS